MFSTVPSVHDPFCHSESRALCERVELKCGRSAVAGIEFESFFYTFESLHLESFLGHVCIEEEAHAHSPPKELIYF